MHRALELAAKGLGWCSPNPPVGAVVVQQGRIVGEGYHETAGQAHAEVRALQDAGEDAKGATLYVTLEPCNHHGRTPPCVDAILAAEIATVVVAVPDPNPGVTGGGMDALRRHGVTVSTGDCAEEAEDLIRAFAFSAHHRRPYVVAKFASSIDGKIATRTGESQWISGEQSRRAVHQLRHEVDAIVVGVETVLADDPRLDARREVPSSDPRPVVFDSMCRMPVESRLFDKAPASGLTVATTGSAPLSRVEALTAAGADVWVLPADDDGRVDVEAALARMYDAGLQSVLVEGGASVLGSFFDHDLVNELHAFVAPIVIGGAKSRSAVAGKGLAQLDAANRLQRKSCVLRGSDTHIRFDRCLQE